MLKKKILPGLLAGTLALVSSVSNVLAYDSVTDTVPNTFTQAGKTFYDIENGKVNGRLDTDDTYALMKKTLTSKIDPSVASPLQGWAALAYGIIGSNPSSYASYGDEDRFGQDKSYDIFKKRFTQNVQEDKGYYGNLYELLSDTTSHYQTTNDGVNDSKWRQDINTYSTGLQSAQNLNQVQEAAFRALADLNGDRNATAKDFKEHHEIKAMSDTAPQDGKESTGTPALYTFVATRDRQGCTYAYDYNLIGLAFYDFSLQPLEGDNGSAVQTALDGMTLEEAIEKVKQGSNIKGFNYTDNPTAQKSIDEKYNYSGSPVTVEKTLGSSESSKASYSESMGKDFKVSSEVHWDFQLHWGTDAANGCWMQTGFKLGAEEITKMAKSEDHSVSKDTSESSKQTITIPAHTMLAIESSRSEKSAREEYNRPVFVSYKVAVFSMNGRYYDDNAAVLSFSTMGYQQRSFFAEIGSSKFGNGAWSNLQARAVDHKNDIGYDRTTGVTRLIGNKHGAGYPEYDWDEPYVDHLDWNAIANNIEDLKPVVYHKTTWTRGREEYFKYYLDYDHALKALTYYLPYSLTGGSLMCDVKATKVAIKEFLPIKTLTHVNLVDPSQEKQTLLQGESFKLSNLNLKGVDEDQISFYGFNANRGQWKLVDARGNVLTSSDLGTITTNTNGTTVFTASTNAEGTAYVKYFVNENAYKLSDKSMVLPEKVVTPTITINVENAASSFEGNIEVPQAMTIEYNKGKPVNLNKLKGLDAYVFDSKGNQLDVPVTWYVKEKGCTMANNRITFNEDGTYHIRARYGNVYSDWTLVTAVETDKELEPDTPDPVVPDPVTPVPDTPDPVTPTPDTPDPIIPNPVPDKELTYADALHILMKFVDRYYVGDNKPEILTATDDIYEWADEEGLLRSMHINTKYCPASEREERLNSTIPVNDFALLMYRAAYITGVNPGGGIAMDFPRPAVDGAACKWASYAGLDISNPEADMYEQAAADFLAKFD